ncbi:MAG: hypothetical protein ACR2QU_06050 [Gammaproteobacteria bacterium]
MNSLPKKRMAIAAAATLAILAIFLFFYPAELSLRYHFAARASDVDAIARYLESQNAFDQFSCLEDEVWTDRTAAAPDVQEALLSLCRSSQILMGYKTAYGSFYPTGTRPWWPDSYMIALIHSDDLSGTDDCERFRKLAAGEECIFRLDEQWAIHYWNAPVGTATTP